MVGVDWAFFWRGCFAPKTQDTQRFHIIFIIYVSYLYYSIPNISFKEPSKGLVFFYICIRILDDLICFQYVSMSKRTPPFLTAKKRGDGLSRGLRGNGRSEFRPRETKLNMPSKKERKHSYKPAIFLGSSRSFSVCVHESKLIYDLSEL